MKIMPAQYSAYARLTNQKALQVAAQIATGRLDPDTIFVVPTADGRDVEAAMRMISMGEGRWVFTPIAAHDDEIRGAWAETLLTDALDELDRRMPPGQSARIYVRPPVVLLSSGYHTALEEAGFRKLGERIEYRIPVDELPGEPPEHERKLTWRSLEEVGEAEAARMLGAVAEGDAHHDADEDPLEALRGFLSDPELSTGSDCVHVGYLRDGDEPAAWVCAQIDPRDGWSRISYMGVLPAHRRKGLGRETHLHGLAMLRDQGGKLYHGGTAGENAAMVRLFERLGAEVYNHQSEWTCVLKP